METVRKYPQAHLDAKQWRISTPSVHHNGFHALVGGRHATGERAYRVPPACNKLEACPASTEDLKDADNNSESRVFRRIIFPQ